LAIVFVTFLYEQLFHALIWLFHILFEISEYVLDFTIEYLFEIGNHETQIVVFYIIVSLIGGGAYRLYRLLPRWCDKFKGLLYEQKTETLTQWQGLSMFGKIGWWSFFMAAINCWLFLT
jgi:hypothetical protein